MKRSLAILAAAGLANSAVFAAESVPRPLYARPCEPQIAPAFMPLPIGAVEPQGWLRDWAVSARNGITGDLDTRALFFRDGWKGVPIKSQGAQPDGLGWPLDSACWMDGAIRLGLVMHDQALIKKIRERLDPIVDAVNKAPQGTSFIHWKKGYQPHAKDYNGWEHAQMGRALTALYQGTGDKRLLDASLGVWKWLDENHMQPYGVASGEEFASGVGPFRKTETCDVSYMLSAAPLMYRIQGDASWGDRIERAFFNAGAASVTRDFQGVAYYQSPNRLNSTNLPVHDTFKKNDKGNYGPLLFSLPIADIDPNTPTKDAKWQYALDTDADTASGITVERSPMPAHWDWPLKSPVTLKVPVQAFDWKPTDFQSLPNAPVERTATATAEWVPYGCTKFRISMFPVTTQAWKGMDHAK